VLSEAMAYDDHAVRLSIEADDVRLAIRAKSAFFPRTAKPRVFLETR
jgi:histone H3/H4